MAELHKKKRQRETDRIWELMQLEDDAFHKKKKVEVEATKKRDSNEDSFNPESSKEENKKNQESVIKKEIEKAALDAVKTLQSKSILSNFISIKDNFFTFCLVR